MYWSTVVLADQYFEGSSGITGQKLLRNRVLISLQLMFSIEQVSFFPIRRKR